MKWKVSRSGTKGKGSWAGCVRKKEKSGKLEKYWVVKIDGKDYYVSRIIYFMTNGVDPYPMEVDHEDRNSLNNSVDNLRLGDRALQNRNQKIRSTNTSGVKGVSKHECGKWAAKLRVEDNLKHLGLFTTIKEAAEARNAAVRKYWPEEVWEANLVDITAL